MTIMDTKDFNHIYDSILEAIYDDFQGNDEEAKDAACVIFTRLLTGDKAEKQDIIDHYELDELRALLKDTLTPAPLDGKNVTTDWIEELFDEQSALYGKQRLVGFVSRATVLCSWTFNSLKWKVLDGNADEAFALLRNRYGLRYPKGDSPFFITEQLTDDTLTWRFYWKNDD
jgi:hypothetical protein